MVAVKAALSRLALTLAFAAAGAYAQAPANPCGGVYADPAVAIEACSRVIEFGSLDKPGLLELEGERQEIPREWSGDPYNRKAR